MKDCEGHETEFDGIENPQTYACRMYVALCSQLMKCHEDYLSDACGDLRRAVTNALTDMLHLTYEEDLDFWEILGRARNCAVQERLDYLNAVKGRCIEQAVEANLKPHSRAEIIAAFAYTRNITVVVAKPAVEDPHDYMGLPEAVTTRAHKLLRKVME